MLDTIRAVHGGQKRIPPGIAAALAEHVADDMLTARELEVLVHVAGGNANKIIAAHLTISEDTVKAHHEERALETGANDLHPRRHGGGEARHHRTLIGRAGLGPRGLEDPRQRGR